MFDLPTMLGCERGLTILTGSVVALSEQCQLYVYLHSEWQNVLDDMYDNAKVDFL